MLNCCFIAEGVVVWVPITCKFYRISCKFLPHKLQVDEGALNGDIRQLFSISDASYGFTDRFLSDFRFRSLKRKADHPEYRR